MSRREKKRFGKAKVGLSISTVLIIILVISNVWIYSKLQFFIDQKRDLQHQVKTLQSQIDSLNITYQDYVSTHNYSNYEYDALSKTYQNYVKNHSYSDSEYNSLRSKYDDYVADHHHTDSEYKELEMNYKEYVESYQKLSSQINLFVLHPKDEDKKFITPDDPSVASKVLEITGGWSDISDWSEFWTDIKAMYDWVVNNIEYRSDGLYPVLPTDPRSYYSLISSMWQFPNQTLELGKGDCEDMAILLASMITGYSGKRYNAECVVITGHVAVYLPVKGDEICILDPSGNYYTNTGSPFYSLTMKDIDTEVYDWLSYWDMNDPEGSPHKVEWVFSAYVYQYFGNTADFINWLYDRP